METTAQIIRSAVEAESVGICDASSSGCLLQTPPDCAVEGCSSSLTVLVFPFIALFIGAVVQPLSRVARVPYTLLLLLVGTVLGFLGCGVDMGLLSTSLRQWVHLDPPAVFFYVFLAPIIFEAAFNTRWHVFRRLLFPIMMLAFVAVIIQCGLIAGFQMLIVRTPDWTWWAALMFGAMLSATDPISVTATLKSVGASETLGTLIEGESLINDGSAFVLWEAFYENTLDENALTVGEIVLDIFRLSLGGAVMGVAFGLAALLVLSLVYDEFEVETSITVVVAFLGFWTAQAPSRLSGVICNVASGLLLSAVGRPLISPDVRGPLSHFWELLGWIANSIVFVHAGVLVSAFVWSCSGEPHGATDYALILAYFVFLQVIRVALLMLLQPILGRGRNKWLTWRESLVVGFSGLRGAVSLILALEVGSSSAVPLNVRSRVLLWTTGIVFLSLLVNGLIIKPLLRILKVDKADQTREEFLGRARALLIQHTLVILDTLAIEGSFKHASWSYIVKNVLPSDWLHGKNSGRAYEDAVEHMVAVVDSASRRASVERARDETRRRLTESARRNSIGASPYSGSDNNPEIARARRMSLSALPPPSAHVLPTPSMPIPPLTSPRRTNIANSPATPRPVAIGPRAFSLDPDSSQRRLPGESGSIGDGRLSHNAFRLGDALSLHTAGGIVEVLQDTVQGARTTTISENPRGGHIRQFLAGTPGFPHLPQHHPNLLPSSNRQSTDVTDYRRSSIDADAQRYGTVLKSDTEVRESLLANRRKLMSAEELPSDTDLDRAVRHRMLTSMLSKVRALANATVSEIAVLVNLDGEIQVAIDRNEAREEYDMFRFLDHRGLQKRWYHKLAERLPQKVRTLPLWEQRITQAHVLIAILTHVLKEDFVKESSVVYFETESLFEAAATLLNQLEALHPLAGLWVESQFAIQLTNSKQEDVLEHMLHHGKLDESEYATLKDQLLETRRRHFVNFGGRRQLRNRYAKTFPRDRLIAHPLFSDHPDLQEDLKQGRLGQLHHPGTGQELDSEPGDLIVVLKGALRPVIGAKIRSEDPAHADHESGEETIQRSNHKGYLKFHSGGTMHWCFMTHNAICAPDLALVANNTEEATCAIKTENLQYIHNHAKYRCSETSGAAAVWTLRRNEAMEIAKSHLGFRTELARSLARQMVLESVTEVPPYALSHLAEALSDTHDENTVIGRASTLLERLPYMAVQKLRVDDRCYVDGVAIVHGRRIQGPGVLLNGTVRVNIANTNGIEGAYSLIHERLTGPALLPAGTLILESIDEVDEFFSDSKDTPSVKSDESAMGPTTTPSAVRFTALGVAAMSLMESRDGFAENTEANGHATPDVGSGAPSHVTFESSGAVYAHVLGETSLELNRIAEARLERWTGPPLSVDQNGRFGMVRDVNAISGNPPEFSRHGAKSTRRQASIDEDDIGGSSSSDAVDDTNQAPDDSPV